MLTCTIFPVSQEISKTSSKIPPGTYPLTTSGIPRFTSDDKGLWGKVEENEQKGAVAGTKKGRPTFSVERPCRKRLEVNPKL